MAVLRDDLALVAQRYNRPITPITTGVYHSTEPHGQSWVWAMIPDEPAADAAGNDNVIPLRLKFSQG